MADLIDMQDVSDIRVGNMISRQAAIDAVRSYYDECDEREESIEERIERLPSADVQPVRHGRWETDGMPMDDGEYLMTRCTVCGTAYEYGHNENYCGYCGARMDGEHDG